MIFELKYDWLGGMFCWLGSKNCGLGFKNWSTPNSALGPRSLAIGAWLVLKTFPSPYVLPCQIWSFYVKVCGHKYGYPQNWGTLGLRPLTECAYPLQTHPSPRGLPCRIESERCLVTV